MGVTKVLMASNDTLFNFEDTLGDRDRDDLLISPRSYPRTVSSTTSTDTSLLASLSDSDPKTYVAGDDVQAMKQNLKLFEFNDDLEERAIQALSDLLSPEQQRTFSEEIHTIEQLSSDLSGTVDATTYTANTLEDLKICISVHSKEDQSSLGSVEGIEDEPRQDTCTLTTFETASSSGVNDLDHVAVVVNISDNEDSSSQEITTNGTQHKQNPTDEQLSTAADVHESTDIKVVVSIFGCSIHRRQKSNCMFVHL